MRYISSRGGIKPSSFEDIVLMGLATDGGLIIPEEIPLLSHKELTRLSTLNYRDLAFEIMSLYAPDYDKGSLKSIIDRSYSDNFDTEEIIPIYRSKDINIAELFHGPTFAFKDMALQFLGNIFEDILIKRDKVLNIIAATSGDTGSAAIYGIKGKRNINLFVLFPYQLVSPIQEMQMTSVLDSNIYNFAVRGNFDDCQSIIKSIFNDLEFKDKYSLGAVNSINWARILAQIVYYFYIYFRCVKNVGDKLNFSVPTGNFGNIFAAYIAKKMGLDIEKIVLATNSNDILSRAVNSGDYTLTDVIPTLSPSMDIQLASNFERYLYYLYDKSSDKINKLMHDLQINKSLDLTDKIDDIHHDFISTSSTDQDILNCIRIFYEDNKYVLDPHTACGVSATQKLGINSSNMVVLATAHPAKFYNSIEDQLGIEINIPNAIKELYDKQYKVDIIDNSVDKFKEIIAKKIDVI